MRVEGYAVGLVDPAKQLAALVAQREQAAVRSVDVKPRTLAAANVGNLRKRVDRARVDRAARCDDQPRPDPGFNVRL